MGVQSSHAAEFGGTVFELYPLKQEEVIDNTRVGFAVRMDGCK